jgi:succinoglycan biosynthesis transport protein ExoP
MDSNMEQTSQTSNLRRVNDGALLRAGAVPALPAVYDGHPVHNDPRFWDVVRRWKWQICLAGFAGIVLGVLATLIQTPLYQATATLEVQNANDNFLNMKQISPVDDTSSGDTGAFSDLQTQIKLIESDSTLDAVKKDLMADPQNAALLPPRSRRGEIYDKTVSWVSHLIHGGPPDTRGPLEKEIDKIDDSMTVRGLGQSRIIEVDADSRDPHLAVAYVNQVAKEFISQNMSGRWEMSQHTSEALAKLLDDTRAKLHDAEAALQSYASTAGLLFTSDRSGAGTKNNNVAEEKLSELQDEYSKATATRIAAQSRYEIAKATLPNSVMPDTLEETSLRDYKDKLADVQRQRGELASTYTANYAKIQRLDGQIAALQASIKGEEENQLGRIKNEYEEAARRENLLSGSYNAQSRTVEALDQRQVQYNILQRDVDGNRQLYDEMLQQVKQATISAAMRSSNVRVVDQAQPPKHRHSPILLLYCAAGLVLSSAVGMFLGFSRERSDTSVKEPGEARYYLGIPELGVLLHDREGRGLLHLMEDSAFARGAGLPQAAEPVNGGSYLRLFSPYFSRMDGAPAANPQIANLETLWMGLRGQHQSKKNGNGELNSFLVMESCRAIVTSLLLAGPNGTIPRSVVITSPGPSEGKTTVVANLGLMLASMGRKVLLVDSDFRRPSLHAFFGLSNTNGLSRLLAGRYPSGVSFETVIQKTRIPRLSVLTTGPTVLPRNDFLHSSDFSELLLRLEEEYEAVLIDTPPVLQVPGARVIGQLTDGVILIARAGETAREAVANAYGRLAADNVRVLGLILNDWNASSSSHSYYADYSREYAKAMMA